jgi:predicted transcriptional regulator YdeE
MAEKMRAVSQVGSIQALSNEAFSAIGHAETMTEAWDPVWKRWRRNSRVSAVLDRIETVLRNDPRTKAYYSDGE